MDQGMLCPFLPYCLPSMGQHPQVGVCPYPTEAYDMALSTAHSVPVSKTHRTVTHPPSSHLYPQKSDHRVP